MTHKHPAEVRVIALEEDRAEMLALFQSIYDAITEENNVYQAKLLAYAAICRYGKK